jgi:chromosome partitioning protein
VLDQKIPKIISLANQKGGVGKTTTTINLGTALAAAGYRTLILDIDPQGNASTGLGIDQDQRELTTYDVLVDGTKLLPAIIPTRVPDLDIVPATTDLSSADVEMVDDARRILRLKETMAECDLSSYAFVLIDCPPSLSLLTLNALAASHSVLVPLQSEFFALEGLSQLMLTLREVRENINTDLHIEGIILTMFDKRNRLSHQVEKDVRENLGDLVFKSIIPRNVRVSEAPSFGLPAILYDPNSTGSLAYRSLAVEFLQRNKKQLEVISAE